MTMNSGLVCVEWPTDPQVCVYV